MIHCNMNVNLTEAYGMYKARYQIYPSFLYLYCKLAVSIHASQCFMLGAKRKKFKRVVYCVKI